jgi:hypothetical protein
MGKVYLIGAGPGDPDLLTVKAARLLARATVVLHDSLVSREVLQLIPREAEIIDVGKRAGQKLLTQDEINQLMIFHGSGRSLDRSSAGVFPFLPPSPRISPRSSGISAPLRYLFSVLPDPAQRASYAKLFQRQCPTERSSASTSQQPTRSSWANARC